MWDINLLLFHGIDYMWSLREMTQDRRNKERFESWAIRFKLKCV